MKIIYGMFYITYMSHCEYLTRSAIEYADEWGICIYINDKRKIGIEHVFGRLKTQKILAEQYCNRGKRLRFNLITGFYFRYFN